MPSPERRAELIPGGRRRNRVPSADSAESASQPRGGRGLRESYFPSSRSPGLGKGGERLRDGRGDGGKSLQTHPVLLVPVDDADIPPSSSLPFPLGKEGGGTPPLGRGREGTPRCRTSKRSFSNGAISAFITEKRATEDRPPTPGQVSFWAKLRSWTLLHPSGSHVERQTIPAAASQKEPFLGYPRGKGIGKEN